MPEHTNTTRLIGEALKAVGAGGLVGVAIIAPNTLQAFESFGIFAPSTPKARRNRLLAELKRQGLILAEQNGDTIHLRLTVKGIHRLQRVEIDELEIKPQKHWDKTWRMVMFDIPARRRESRYILTSQLRRLGFVMVQQSLWVHPYPCFDIVQQVVAYANLQQFVSIAEITRLDESSTKRLLRYFPDLK